MECIGFSQNASATIIVQLDSITPYIPVPGSYRWTFTATATPTDGFIAGGDNYFTIYDLPGPIVTVEANGAYWNSASSQLLGITPLGQNPTDDITLPNVTFKYTDLGSRPGNAAFQPGDHFDIMLNVSTPTEFVYSWQDYSAYPVSSGQLQSGIGTIVPSNIPEPATIGLIGLGLAGLGFSRRKRVS